MSSPPEGFREYEVSVRVVETFTVRVKARKRSEAVDLVWLGQFDEADTFNGDRLWTSVKAKLADD